MKRKPSTSPETVVPEEILERAKAASLAAGPRPNTKCVVCGSPVAPKSSEDLCWVCRRLKISAWRDSDQQIPLQD